MGVTENPLNNEKYFIMQFLRNRDYTKTFKPFLMKYDENATWFNQLEPAHAEIQSV